MNREENRKKGALSSINFDSAYDSKIKSFYKIAESGPNMFQTEIKKILTKSQLSAADKAATLHKSCFLYFFQLLGIKEEGNDNKKLLDTLFAYLKSGKVKNRDDLTKEQLALIKFDAEAFTFSAVPGGPSRTKA